MAAFKLDIDNARRDEPRADEPHYHVWRDTKPGRVLICEPPRFATRQAAGQAAARQMERGTFKVMKCDLPCRFTLPRKRRRRKA